MVKLEIHGSIAHIQLNRPEKLNAMNWALWEGMPGIIEQIDENMDVRCAILYGEGDAFSVGLDFFDVIPRLGDPHSGPDGERQRRLQKMIRTMQEAVTCVERCRVPVIGAIHGYCLGGAIDLITACDIRIAAADAVFGVRETRMAIVADLGTLQRLPRIISPGVARELVFTGRDFDAAYAEKINLVNEVCDTREALLAKATALAEAISANAPLAVQGSKRVMNATHAADIDRELEYVSTWNTAHMISQDLAHAIESFATRKAPKFKGR